MQKASQKADQAEIECQAAIEQILEPLSDDDYIAVLSNLPSRLDDLLGVRIEKVLDDVLAEPTKEIETDE